MLDKKADILDLYYPREKAWPEYRPTPSAIAFKNFVKDVCVRLAELAKIEDSRRTTFESRVSAAFYYWDDEISREPPRPASDKTEMDKLVADIQEKTIALRISMENLHRCTAGYGCYGFEREFGINYVLRTLSMLEYSIEERGRATSKQRRKGRGRPPGNKRYPGLEVLVSCLELAALESGGSFSLYKQYRKGTLIEALNWLKTYCEARPEWQKFSTALPPPSKHPVFIYESQLLAARRDWKGSQPENSK